MKKYWLQLKSIFTGGALKDVWKWSRCVRGKVMLLCILGVAGTLLSLGVTLSTRELIDGAVAGDSRVLWLYGGILAALILSQRGLSVWGSLLRTRASAFLQRHLQHRLTQELLEKEYASVRGYHSGELVNRFFTDVRTVRDGVLSVLPGLFRILFSFAGASVILLSIDSRFILLMILCGVVSLCLTLVFQEPMKKRHKRMRDAEGALHASAQETMENLRIIKASLSEERAMDRLDLKQQGLENEQMRQGRFGSLMNNSVGLLFDLSWLICMVWGCVGIFEGRMTYGALAAMIQLIGRIQGPLANALHLAGQIYGVTSSAERLKQLLDLPQEVGDEPVRDFDSMRLEHVSFCYDDGGENVLRDVNCVIRKGEFVAMTGISGGGKTSLFQLLLGIFRPTGGRVLFDSDGRTVPASKATRTLIAYVPQGNTLMSGSLKENLTLFTDDATQESILDAVRTACIDDLYEEIGPNALLGERGIGLSEGQAQRVAVARALLSNAPILLLDEATSALDEATESRMLSNIAKLKNRTCVTTWALRHT